jgi:hypothetical protein
MSDTKRESVITKVRALRAITVENGATEAEAQSAAAKVDQLLRDYEINLSETEVRQMECIKVMVSLPKAGKQAPINNGLLAIARFCDCKVWYDSDELTGETQLAVFGFETDVVVYEYLYYLIQRAIERETGSFTMLNFEYNQMSKFHQRQARDSFSLGLVDRVGERLKEMRNHRDQWHKQATGTSLVVVKSAQVQDEFDKLNLDLRKSKTRRTAGDAAAFSRGRSAGDRVGLNKGVKGYASTKKLSA